MNEIKSINPSSNISLGGKKSQLKTEQFFFVIMRLNLRALLLFLCLAVVIITFSIYMKCSDIGIPNGIVSSNFYVNHMNGVEKQTHFKDIECNVNQVASVQCKIESDTSEVYVPFSFIKKYWEIYGTVSTGDNGDSKLLWTHSNSKINLPKGKYDPKGIFMYFENYNVEVRERVKCISASLGVPVSTQWEKRGYYYPTQIAQFGLSHYSKNLTEPEPSRQILEDAEVNKMDWYIPKSSNLTRVWHTKFNTSVVKFETGNSYENAIITSIDNNGDTNSVMNGATTMSNELDLVLSIDVYLATNSSSILVQLYNEDIKKTYNISYILADILISIQGDYIYYGLGASTMNHWKHLTRDLFVDLQKGVKGSRFKRSDIRIKSIALLGFGMFDNVTLSSYDHMAHFYDAAEWFVNNLDRKTGGWPNPVKRSLAGFTELKAGWLSSMGSGHGISVLARAFKHSGGNKKYLRAAAQALKPFKVMAKDGGVLAKFMGQYNWYEEYPTSPPSFVLNGFIYSLLGLYDLSMTAPQPIAKEAGKLYRHGLNSLKKMLLLFDTGSGTTYDLRHLSLGVAPNLARWDYHATHVNQLLLLATIDSDVLISQTAERWKGYMFGKRAKHN